MNKETREKIDKMLAKYTFTNVVQPYTYDQRKGLTDELESLIQQEREQLLLDYLSWCHSRSLNEQWPDNVKDFLSSQVKEGK